MRKISKLFPLSLIFLVSCGTVNNGTTKYFYYFNSNITVTLYDGLTDRFSGISYLCNQISSQSNFYLESEECGLYKINHSQDKVEVDKYLFELLSISLEMEENTNGYYNPFIGSLSNEWKNSLDKKEVLDDATIQTELEKVNNTSLTLSVEEDKYYAQRSGYAQIDLGGLAKGYALDVVKDYLESYQMKKYLFNAGNSAILLGEKPSEKVFTVSLKDIENAYVQLNNCCIGVSGVGEQGVKIDDVIYSHIINPFTGSAINNYDFVFVTGSNGAICDGLSTAFMLMDIDQVKELEEEFSVKALLYKDKQIVYKNDGIELKYF